MALNIGSITKLKPLGLVRTLFLHDANQTVSMHCRALRQFWSNCLGPNDESSEILQELSKLERVGSVLHVAAHPDDENTTLLTYLAHEERLETAYLSLTRGGGGQISLALSSKRNWG